MKATPSKIDETTAIREEEMAEARQSLANPSYFCMTPTTVSLSPEARAALKGRKAALLLGNKWNTGAAIMIRFLEGDPQLQRRVRDAALMWVARGAANLQLRFVENGPTNIRIAFQAGAGSWSYIGTMCMEIPEPQATMNFGWLTPASDDATLLSVVLHEFGHAIGLIHEHQNPEHAIRWNREAVIRDLSGPPNNWDEATIQSNIFDAYDRAKVAATPVDALSIMMYPIPRSWTLDGFSTGFNASLSENDRRLISQQYPL
jgi:hypothetical protein